MNIKMLLISVGMAAALAACGSSSADVETPALANDEIVTASSEPAETALSETSADDMALSEAEIEAMLAQMSPANTMAEVTLDETAMADFLGADMTTTASGLQYAIEEEGSGPIPETGDVVQLHYTGRLADGTIFDSTVERDQPFAFPLGQGLVIPGWDEAVSLLNVGSTAKLVLPPEIAYGPQGIMGVIPANATLYFEVELLDILPGSPDAPQQVATADFTTTDSGLKYYDFVEGSGLIPQTGQPVVVHYTGWLEDGTKFDSSLDRGMPFVFPVGLQYVIPGWDEGIAGMKVGGKRQLIIPAELAYGEQGAGDIIPSDATLIFEVELLEVQS